MKLTHVRVTKYRCIEDTGLVTIEPDVTVFIGRNESGKTAFIEALRRLNPADGATFDVTTDYPRAQLAAYERRHDLRADTAVTARFLLESADIQEVERRFGRGILTTSSIEVRRAYDGRFEATLEVADHLVIAQLLAKRTDLEPDLRALAEAQTTFPDLITILTPFATHSRSAAVLLQVARQLHRTPLSARIWNEVLAERLPRFIAFGDDGVMPSSVALSTLTDPAARHAPGTAAVLSLLDLAGVAPEDLHPDHHSYESLKARIEASAHGITDDLATYWTRNPNLEVTVDVSLAGPLDLAFPVGEPILHIRVGPRQRRASLPIGERSRGFAWFFSFLVRLTQLSEFPGPLVLLLDEPGPSLHATAQGDFLRLLESRLGPSHQVLFTTHSPFLLDASHIQRTRAVLLDPDHGTQLSADLTRTDPDTLRPLRAALATALANYARASQAPTSASSSAPPQATLIVTEPSDFIWLRLMTTECQRRDRPALDPRIRILPLGAGAALAPYALLQDADQRQLTILVDGALSLPARRELVAFAKTPLAQGLRLIAISELADDPTQAQTLEDLIDPGYWLSLVTEAYRLSPPMIEAQLPPTGGLIARTTRALANHPQAFDRLRIAEVALARVGTPLPPDMVHRFARLFSAVNATLPAAPSAARIAT